MQALSLDLRERIVALCQQGLSKVAVAARFIVSLSSVKRFVKQFESHGHVRPIVQRRMQGKLTKRWRKRLVRQIERYPDYTLSQHAMLWNKHYALQVSESCLSRTLRAIGITRKKKTLGALERDDEARRIFREVISRLEAENIVVVDEMGSRIGMVPLYARSLRGSRAYDKVVRNYGQNITLLASMTLEGMQTGMTLDGAVDEAAFEHFVEQVLLPTLRPGQIVLLDNLAAHHSERVEHLVKQAGCELLFLPAYSPDFSPIEEAFSKLKAFIRRCHCQTKRALLKALKRGLDSITAADAQGWFVHAGFSVSTPSA